MGETQVVSGTINTTVKDDHPSDSSTGPGKRRLALGIELARKYYQIVSIVNDLDLPKGQIMLMAYTAVYGNMSYPENRKRFCAEQRTTMATVNNSVSKLTKRGILHKPEGVIKLIPVLTKLSFARDVRLDIQLKMVFNEVKK